MNFETIDNESNAFHFHTCKTKGCRMHFYDAMFFYADRKRFYDKVDVIETKSE